MENLKKTFSIVVIFLILFIFNAMAQPGGPTGPGGDPGGSGWVGDTGATGVPVDGISILALLGISYGVAKLRKKKKFKMDK